MTKGFTYYYMIECYQGFNDNQTYTGKSFHELYKNFKGLTKRPQTKDIQKFVEMYDSGQTGAYYHIHCVFVYPDGDEKIIYTARGL